MRLTKKEFIYEFTQNQADFREIHTNILEGMDVHGSNFIVLMCAILIASIGLNMNSTAVVIGAMLISPLMGSITGIGYGIGTFNIHLLKSALKIFILAAVISIITSTIYFAVTPITTPGSEILARAEPTIWDVLIAFLGGIVGMIGLTRKKPTNVIPGVAIATALMPPLCTVGYGLANFEFSILFGAAYLFLINCFFISVGTLLVTKMLRIPVWINVDRSNQKRVKYVMAIISVVVMIPSVFSAVQLIQDSMEMGQLNEFAKKELPNYYVLDSNVDRERREVTFVVIGNEITKEELSSLSTSLERYGFEGMELNIQQSKDDLSIVRAYNLQFEKYLQYLSQNQNVITSQSDSKPSVVTKQQLLTEVKTLYKNIDEAYVGILSTDEVELPVLLIYTSDDLSLIDKEQVRDWLAVRLNIDVVEVIVQESV